MVGVDIVDQGGKADAGRLDVMLEGLKDRGFLCETDMDRNVLTFMPPLVVPRQALDRLLGTCCDVLEHME